jgi:hypothetical protein
VETVPQQSPSVLVHLAQIRNNGKYMQAKGSQLLPKRGLVEGLVHHTDAYEQEEHPPRDGHVLEFHTTNPTEAVVWDP